MTDLLQLRMCLLLTGLTGLPSLPGECKIRPATTNDVAALAGVLTAGFEEVWTEGRVLRELLEDPNVPVTFVAERTDQLVGTASYQEKPDFDTEAGWLHWVGVHPSARGASLGACLSQYVIHEAAMRGKRRVYLTTDDFRLPAIRTYLKLGFEPDCWHESHRQRWTALCETLGRTPK